MTTINYNNSTIATIPTSGGTKTLKCDGKIMNGEVTVTSEPGYKIAVTLNADGTQSWAITDNQ